MRIDVKETAQQLSATINTCCREERNFNREELLKLLSEIYSYPERITGYLRKKEFLSYNRKHRLYKFKKQAKPIMYTEFINMLSSVEYKKKAYVPYKKKETSLYHFPVSSFTNEDIVYEMDGR